MTFSQKVFSQETSPAIDSLRQILRTAQSDTTKVKTLLECARQFMKQDEIDSAMNYCNASMKLAEKSNFTKGITDAYYIRGKLYIEKGNYNEALNDYNAELKIHEALGDKKNMANVYNLIANAFHMQGDFPNALKNQYTALKIREEIGDEEGMSWSYNNIGSIYRIQGDYPAALKNYFATLKIQEKFGDRKNIATVYMNVATVYSLQGKYTEALTNYLTSLKIRESLDDKKDIIASYFNIGDTFCDLHEKDSLTKEVTVALEDENVRSIPRSEWLNTAMEIQLKAHKMNEEFGNKYYSIFSLSGMGRTNFLLKKYSESKRSSKLFKDLKINGL